MNHSNYPNPMSNESLSGVPRGKTDSLSKATMTDLMADLIDLADMAGISTMTMAGGLMKIDTLTIETAIDDLALALALLDRFGIAARSELRRRGSAQLPLSNPQGGTTTPG